MTARFVVECARAPLVVVTVVDVPSLEAIDVGLAELDAFLAKRQRYAILVDLSRVGLLPATHRRARDGWLATNSAAAAELCAGVAYVAPSPFSRAIAASMIWNEPPPVPYVVLGSLERRRTMGARGVCEAFRRTCRRGVIPRRMLGP